MNVVLAFNPFAAINQNPYVESVEDVWVVWAVSLFILVAMIAGSVRKLRLHHFRRFFREEKGASYALPYVLTFPFILILVCVMIQCTLILLVKCGSVYASYAAARSAIVWRSSDPESDAKGLQNAKYYANRAAMLGMTPFSSGYESHAKRVFPLLLAETVSSGEFPFSDPQIHTIALDQFFDLYSDMYVRLAQQHNETGKASAIIKQPNALAREGYVKNKLIYAGLATSVEFEDSFKQQAPVWNEDVRVTVKHKMHLHIPVAARVLNNDAPGGFLSPLYFARDIQTTVTLPSEACKDTPRLGVPYDPAFMSRYFNFN
ncbi:hypothetical protein [Neorhodopirellula pilleata]|uniref:Uncharacterized protein n=1 Tax=Neorhodopirellula pilleata TaxID=2714738 RepID=A0A5C6AZX4_9BACT|nr:hypothetical protein [Neorhodopirellula pilleata]TWU03694.1 hypothetical protein Pla100_06240 [Neorhodopirellula pilleata]